MWIFYFLHFQLLHFYTLAHNPEHTNRLQVEFVCHQNIL